MDVYRLKEAEFQNAYGILCAAIPKAGKRDGLYPTFCKILSGEKSTRHAHFEPEIFFIVKGIGEMAIENERQSVRAGDLIRIPPFAHHELTGTSDLAFLSIYAEDSEVPALPRKAIVTAAPPTPNGPLHLGHISGPYLASDVVARHLANQGVSVHSHCGTDDHQNYVAERARAINTSAEDFRARQRERIERCLQTMNIHFEEFIEPKYDTNYQKRIQAFARQAVDRGIIVKETLELPHCPQCALTLVDALISGNCPSCGESSKGGCESCGMVVPPKDLLHAKCARCGHEAVNLPQEVFTFDLSKYFPAIAGDLETLRLTPRLKELLGRVLGQNGLKVLVSHAGEGIPFPGTNQVIHVWFEMAAHYERFATGADTWIHCFGFDNSFYYLAFIPALLRALNPNAHLPSTVITNEFLLLDGAKFSTSRGHAIWADEFQGNTDHLRLYLSLHRPSQRQSDFALADFEHFSARLGQHLQRVQSGTATPQTIVACERFTRDMEYLLAPENFDLRQAAHRLLTFIDFATQETGTARTLANAMEPIMPMEAKKLHAL